MTVYVPDRVTIAGLPSGEAGVVGTLKWMERFARDAAHNDHAIRMLALGQFQGLAQKDYIGEAKRLHAFVRDRIRYVRDPEGRELVQTPQATLGIGQGDCDDKATLLASLLMATGHPVRFVAVAVGPNPNLSHVYVETRIGTSWVPAETTEPWPFGVAPKGITRYKVWTV